MKQPIRVFNPRKSALLELFPELLKLFLELLDFRRKLINFLFQTRPSRWTRSDDTLLFRERLDIDLAIEQMREPAFFLSRLTRQSRDEWLLIA